MPPFTGARSSARPAATFSAIWAEQGLDEIWNAPDYADFRRRVRNFEFSPCYRCSLCENWEQGLTDCYGNDAPTCGGCLWSEGVISCP